MLEICLFLKVQYPKAGNDRLEKDSGVSGNARHSLSSSKSLLGACQLLWSASLGSEAEG